MAESNEGSEGYGCHEERPAERGLAKYPDNEIRKAPSDGGQKEDGGALHRTPPLTSPRTTSRAAVSKGEGMSLTTIAG